MFFQTDVCRQSFRTHHFQIQTGTSQHFFNEAAAPRTRKQFFFSLGCVGRFFDEPDDFIDIGQCDGFAFGNMPFVACLLQPEKRTSGNDFAAVAQEFGENLFQVQQARLSVDQNYHIDAETVLQRSQFVELV